MKNPPILDVLFIVVSCIIFVVLNYFGYLEQISRFSYLILIVGYFIGKLVTMNIQKRKIKD